MSVTNEVLQLFFVVNVYFNCWGSGCHICPGRLG